MSNLSELTEAMFSLEVWCLWPGRHLTLSSMKSIDDLLKPTGPMALAGFVKGLEEVTFFFGKFVPGVTMKNLTTILTKSETDSRQMF